MTQITLDKTWLVKELFIDSGVAITNSKLAILGIKNLMIESGWTVVSSSNSTTADNNDNWNSVSDIVNATGNHSWIVLENTAIASNFQVCFDLSNSIVYYMTCVVSYNSGFSGGTISARPTASDQIIILNNLSWDGALTDANYRKIVYFYSNDYKCNRIHIGKTISASSTSVSFMMFDYPKEPASWWTTPFISCCGAIDMRITYVNYCKITTTPLYTLVDGQTVNLALGSWGVAGPYGNSNIGKRPDLNGGYSLSPIPIISNTASRPGILGLVADMWWVSADLPEGTYIPTTAGPRSLFVIGNAAHGSNGSRIGI